MSGESPGEIEGGQPGKRGAFVISLPWIVRLVLTMGVGAVIGFAAGTLLSSFLGNRASQPIMVAAGAAASIILSFRRIHGWDVSTFVDGTIVGLAAPPLFMIFVFFYATPLAETQLAWAHAGQALTVLAYGFIAVPITIPCGWMAGFAYHLLLSAAERRRRATDDTDSA